MDVTQVRLPQGLIDGIEILVDKGLYANKSDAVRDAVRKLILEGQIGSIPNTGDSVKEMREIKKKLSQEIKSSNDLKEINKLTD